LFYIVSNQNIACLPNELPAFELGRIDMNERKPNGRSLIGAGLLAIFLVCVCVAAIVVVIISGASGTTYPQHRIM
jgi:hypothetical protein